MTVKRFEYDKDTCCFIDNNEFQIKAKSVNEIVDMLNAFNEENEQLKHKLTEREKMLDIRDKIIADVSKALWGNLE